MTADPTTHEPMSPLRARTIAISEEYWAARAEGMTERLAIAQIALAIARREEALGLLTPTAPFAAGPPPECPTGEHDWYTHEYNTPCYGWDGEINLPPGTVHCRSCFKVKGARRRLVTLPSQKPRSDVSR